jgi:hypothetical protein
MRGKRLQYSSRDQTVRFAYATSLRVEGKQTHMLCKSKPIETKQLRQRATKYCRWEIFFFRMDSVCFLTLHPSQPLRSPCLLLLTDMERTGPS